MNYRSRKGLKMWWMYGGFISAFYAALGIYAIFEIFSNTATKQGVFSILVIVPLLIIGISAEIFMCLDEKKIIKNAIKNGVITKLYAYGVGFLMGIISILIMALCYYFELNLPLWVLFAGIFGNLIICPVIGVVWLYQKSKPPGQDPGAK